MRPIALVANGAMLAWTPVDGGHYFIDLIAGIAVAVLAIFAARRICRAVTLWLPELVRARDIRKRLRYRPNETPLPAEDHQDKQNNKWRGETGNEHGALPFCAQDNLASARLRGGIRRFPLLLDHARTIHGRDRCSMQPDRIISTGR
jgi:hypothetical protein